MIKIGCSGWLYNEWKKNFYPEKLTSSEYFSFYSAHFDTVEINSTFYHSPSIKTVHRWKDIAPTGFIYSLKAPRFITHQKKFKNCVQEIEVFYSLADILQEKLGCILFQCPPSLTYHENFLYNILNCLNSNYKNVIEFRHPSWWRNDVMQELEQKNATFCTVSGMHVPETLCINNKKCYIRFHGSPDYSAKYSANNLKLWKNAILENIVDEVWMYFNNTYACYAPYNALTMKHYFQHS
ncbi:MAG: DUF72 domain-containing protein [Candidatus Nucleicultricaceae bacterium]